MKSPRLVIIMLLALLLLVTCTSVPKFSNEVSSDIKSTYYQHWNSGLQNGKSGTDLYIQLIENSVILDSVLFKGQISKLNQTSYDSLLYVAHLGFKLQSDKDLIKSSFGKFQINEDECVISYHVVSNKKRRFSKISNLEEQKSVNYPSSPVQN
ncbi:hypothetical protein [uncultured Winogradskyella sp.]|uniref:hypothetical protein n=1 Tax=uncultured Winogradskyella sp. TaxID=395353 RepID=UPI0026248490|nr:hypothetical protein [uncultured Winogradskyella sp.]